MRSGGLFLESRSLGLNTSLKSVLEVLNHPNGLCAGRLELLLESLCLGDRFGDTRL
jgi:hypothetical protein